MQVRKFLREYKSAISISANKVSSITTLAEADCYIPDRKLMQPADERGRYINLQNGLYNLETHVLEAHRPELYFTSQLPFAYNEDADCPYFRRYLRTSLVIEQGEADEQSILFAHEALAYSMTARTDLKASFWVIGKPDSGKSTLIGFIRALMGSLHATIDLNQLAGNKYILSGIVGKRAVTFTEARAGSVLPDDLYKAMVGGQDEIYAEAKYKDGFSFKPEAKFWWAMNDAPRTTDRSGAVVNRLKPLLFNHTIPPDMRIPDLDKKLVAELPGIFNVLIFAYKRLVRAGKFTEPEQSRRWLETYRLENDTEATFINDCTIREPGSSVQAETLIERYRSWCIQNGFNPKNSNMLARELRRLGFEDRRNNGRTFWHGLRLQTRVI
jgi:putative DNA primase/helicase